MSVGIVWFRQDLRLADNPALTRALEENEWVIAVYVHAPEEGQTWSQGSASRWWLHHSLSSLDTALRQLGSRLLLLQGDSLTALTSLVQQTGATHLYWNRLYEPAFVARDTQIKQVLLDRGLGATSFNASLLHEPWAVLRDGATPYRVFTPYWKAVLAKGPQRSLLPLPKLVPTPQTLPAGVALPALALLPKIPWDQGFRSVWQVGEDAAHERLKEFLLAALKQYREGRDRPDLDGTSRLSPYLHFGELSPAQIIHEIQLAQQHLNLMTPAAESYVRELVWREFAYSLLYHFPKTQDECLDQRFQQFPWRTDYRDDLGAWQCGHTGFPLVDAGMRQLWQTGWMHNRVRMVVASFLIKNLLIPWQEGARWFWDTLVDADLANNTLGWQWVAGCGADAAPYFRIFNPVLQGQKFDPQGEYVRRWVPELEGVPARFIHQPWLAPVSSLSATYPKPLVELSASRKNALDAFSRISH